MIREFDIENNLALKHLFLKIIKKYKLKNIKMILLHTFFIKIFVLLLRYHGFQFGSNNWDA